MKKKMMAMFLAAGIIAAGVTGCGQQGAGGTTASTSIDSGLMDDANESVNVYIGGTIFDESMDPVKGFMTYAYPFVNEALLQADVNSKYIPSLATAWEVSADGLTYTYTLREGVMFSDGSEFTSDDVVFTYEEVMKNQANNENVDLTKLESVKADGDYKVVFKLKEPYSPFVDTTAMLQIVPSDSYDSTTFDTMPIGTGAYQVLQYDSNQQIILGVNENYWGDIPDIEKVNIVSMDQDTAYSNAVSGQLDVVMVSSTYINEKIDGMNLKKLETMDVRNISLPTLPVQSMKNSSGETLEVGNNVTSSLAVRKALTLGIDRQTIINNAFNGEGKPAIHFTNNLPWAPTDTYNDKQVEEAKKILEEDGWVDMDGDGIREKDGVKCSFDVIAPGNDEDRYKLATAVAQSAKELGIELKVRNESWDTAYTLTTSTPIVWGWGQFSPTAIENLYYSKSFLESRYGNVSGLTNPEVDKAISNALSATDTDTANKEWAKAQSIGNEQVPYLFVVNIEHSYFVNDNLDISEKTQIPHPHGHGSPVICNLKDWVLN